MNPGELKQLQAFASHAASVNANIVKAKTIATELRDNGPLDLHIGGIDIHLHHVRHRGTIADAFDALSDRLKLDFRELEAVWKPEDYAQ